MKLYLRSSAAAERFCQIGFKKDGTMMSRTKLLAHLSLFVAATEITSASQDG